MTLKTLREQGRTGIASSSITLRYGKVIFKSFLGKSERLHSYQRRILDG